MSVTITGDFESLLDGGTVEFTASRGRVKVGPYVEASPAHHMPAWMEVELFGFDGPNAFARIELRENVPRLVEFGFRSGPDAREIMPKDLREVDLYSVIDALYRGFVIRMDHGRAKHDLDSDSDFSRQIRDFLDQRRSGKRRVTGALLAQVAAVYRENIEHAPTAAVARTFGVKHRQATDYVKQARDRGLLPPTKQGRAKA